MRGVVPRGGFALALVVGAWGSARWDRCVVGRGFYDGEWVRTDDPTVTGVCSDAATLDWRFIPSDPLCAFKRASRGAFFAAARDANITSIFMPGDSVNEDFAKVLQTWLRGDDNKKTRACRSIPGLDWVCARVGDDGLEIGMQKTYFMCPVNVTAHSGKMKWISGDRYVPYWREFDMVVFNWGAHYGGHVSAEAMFRAHLASMTAQVAAELANASRRTPWLVLRSTSAAHSNCWSYRAPINESVYVSSMFEPGNDPVYGWSKFRNLSDIASAAWERPPFNATMLYEYPLSRGRPDLHVIQDGKETGHHDCLHFHKTMTQCANHSRRRLLDGHRESEQREMASWWVVLLYNLIDARNSRDPG